MAIHKASAAVMQRRNTDSVIDFYPTPPTATHMFMKWLNERHTNLDSQTVWEPAAGASHMVDVLMESFGETFASDLHDPAGFGWKRIDFASELLTVTVNDKPDWIITNPPFNLALEFTQNGIKHSKTGYAMIMRIAFVESLKRYQNLFQSHPPSDILIHVKRVSMQKNQVDESRSSAVCYAWFVWDKTNPNYQVKTELDWLV